MLEVNGFSIDIPMYIDSGADISLIPYKLGRALGLKREPSDIIYQMKGIADKGIPYILKEVTFILNNERIKARTAWALAEKIPALLGRMDIFNRFKVIFNEHKEHIDFDAL